MKAEEAVDRALSTVPRNPDGSADEKTLIDEIMALLDFDPEQELRNKATRALDRRKKPGASEPDGQITIPGLGTYGYEPDRLVADNDDHVVEQAKARPNFKEAEAARARKNARQQQIWADRKTEESALFAEWSLKELAAGRDLAKITFDPFVRETGLWDPGDGPTEPDDGGDDS
jgi:hypothetical protein